MGCVEGIGNLDAEVEHGFEVERLPCDLVLQGRPVEEFHNDERLSVRPAEVMDRANVRMVQSGGSAGFTTEAFQCLWVVRHVIGQEFEGDKTTKIGVLSFVNDTHSTTAQLLCDAVVRDGLPDKLGGCSHWGK